MKLYPSDQNIVKGTLTLAHLSSPTLLDQDVFDAM